MTGRVDRELVVSRETMKTLANEMLVWAELVLEDYLATETELDLQEIDVVG